MFHKTLLKLYETDFFFQVDRTKNSKLHTQGMSNLEYPEYCFLWTRELSSDLTANPKSNLMAVLSDS